MIIRNPRLLVLALAITLTVLPVQAGTLDDAPFRFVPATKDWHIDDSSLRQMAEDIYIIATLSNSNQSLSITIVKTDMNRSETNAFEEFYGGMRNALTKGHVKILLDEPTTFLHLQAHRFAYETPLPNGLANYTETILFPTPTTAWCVSAVSFQNQTNDVRQIFQLFQIKK